MWSSQWNLLPRGTGATGQAAVKCKAGGKGKSVDDEEDVALSKKGHGTLATHAV